LEEPERTPAPEHRPGEADQRLARSPVPPAARRLAGLALLAVGCYSPDLSGRDGGPDASAGLDGPGACSLPFLPPGCLDPIWLPCGGCQLECENELDWFTAHEFCGQRIGGHLVFLETLEESDCVAAAIGSDEVWIGLVQDATNLVDAAWRWSDGSALVFVGWASGEPDDEDGEENEAENQAVLRRAEGWVDLSGSANLSAFVCEFP
jgi:hypothetical protein